jgi:hypothetical protein
MVYVSLEMRGSCKKGVWLHDGGDDRSNETRAMLREGEGATAVGEAQLPRIYIKA